MNIYLVGGAVRDMVMGVEPKDRDYVVVGSTHDEMISAGYQKVGADFPVYLDHLGQEYALARTERSIGQGYNDFVTDFDSDVTLEDDLYRRDFTMNAMALDFDGVVIDPYNGQEHIKQKVLKVVNSKVFHEDPVRALRACRFAARYDFKICNSVHQCIYQCIADGRMKHLTTERVWLEFEKAFGPKFSNFVFLMKVSGIMNALDFNLNYGTSSKHLDSKPIVQFAAIAIDTDQSNLNKFYSVAKVPSDFKKFADIAHKFFITDSCEEEAVLLYNMFNLTKSKFRSEMFELIDKSFRPDFHPMYRFNIEDLKRIEKAFDSVTSSDYSNLEGKELGNAIRLGKIRAIETAIWDNMLEIRESIICSG